VPRTARPYAPHAVCKTGLCSMWGSAQIRKVRSPCLPRCAGATCGTGAIARGRAGHGGRGPTCVVYDRERVPIDRATYFCSREITGFSFSWIWGLPSGEPGMRLARFCVSGLTRTSCSSTHLLSGRSNFRQGMYSWVVSRSSSTHLVVHLQAFPVGVPFLAALFANLLDPEVSKLHVQILRTARDSSSFQKTVLRVAVLVLAQHKVIVVHLAELPEEEGDRLERRRRCTDLIHLRHILGPRQGFDIREGRVLRFTVRRHTADHRGSRKSVAAARRGRSLEVLVSTIPAPPRVIGSHHERTPWVAARAAAPLCEACELEI